MKKINSKKLSSLLGGWFDDKECARIQAKVPQSADSPEWDNWLQDFDRYCLGL